MDIIIRNIEASTAAQLTELAKMWDYNSREDYLRDQLRKIAKDNIVYQSDVRYEHSMNDLAHQIKTFGDILQLNVSLGMLESPFEFDKNGNIVGQKTLSEIKRRNH